MPGIQSFSDWEKKAGTAPQSGGMQSFSEWESQQVVNTSQKKDFDIDRKMEEAAKSNPIVGASKKVYDFMGNPNLPKLNLAEHKNPIANFILKDLPEGIVNQPASSIESGLKLQRNKIDKSLGKKGMSWQQELGETANVALLPLDIITGGGAVSGGKALLKSGGKAVIKQLAKKGAIQGAKVGATYGALKGAHTGKDKDIAGQATDIGVGAVTGGVGGAVAGGVLSGAGGVFKNLFAKEVAPEVIARAEKAFTTQATKVAKQLGRELTDEEGDVLAREIASEYFAKGGSKLATKSTVLAKGGKPRQMIAPNQVSLGKSVTEDLDPVKKLLVNVSMTPDKPKREGILSKIYTSVFDRFHPITRLTKGVDIPTGENPKFLIKRYLGIQGIADAKINWKTTRLNPETGRVEITGEGLKPIVQRFMQATGQADEQEITAYMLAQHYQELLNRNINPLEGKATKENVAAKAREALAHLASKYNGDLTQFEQAATDIRQWSVRAMLDPLLEVGRISKETYDRILTSNQFYVPLKRVMEEVETRGIVPTSSNIFVSKGNPLKAVRGSGKLIVNPLESLINDAYYVTNIVERDRVARSVVNLRNLSDELKELIVETKPKLAPVAREKMTAEVDKEFMGKLTRFAKSLGLKKFSTEGQAGRNLGYFRPGTKELVRRFGTSRETLAHEVGHFLDDKFSLYQRFLRNTKATRKVGQEVFQHSVEAGESQNRLNNAKERFANAFSWWMTHRDLAQKQMPKFTKAMTKILDEIPELKPLLDIKPTPRPAVEEMEKTIFRPNIFNPGDNIMTVFENGEMKFYKVPKDVFDAAAGMNEKDLDILTKMLAVPASMQRAGATLAPEFVIRNPVRDQFSAWIYSKYGYRPPIDFFRGLSSVIGRDDIYQEWLASGGAHSTMVSIDRQTSSKTLQQVLNEPNFNWKKPQMLLKKVLFELQDMDKKNPKAYLETALKPFQALSETTEQATRVGLYKRALDKKASTMEAVFESREGTLDFANRGTVTRAFNAAISFWNATVQGNVRMVQAFKDNPMQTSAKVVTGITLPTLLLYAVNKDNPRYQELPQWQKDFFWIVDIGKDKPLVRIPKPFELGLLFGTSAEHMLDFYYERDPEAATSFLKTLADGAAPGVLPTAVVPPIEVWANRSFFTGLPIDTAGEERLPAEMRYGENTALWAKGLAQAIKDFTDYGVSPDKIERMWTGYTATLGRTASQLVDVPLHALEQDAPVDPAMTAADWPLIKGFVAREPIGSQSKSVNDFYTNLKIATESKEGVKKIQKEGRMEEVPQYLKDNPEAYLAAGMESISDTLSELRKTRLAILGSKTMTADQKREAITKIDTQSTLITKKANAMFEKVMQELRKRGAAN